MSRKFILLTLVVFVLSSFAAVAQNAPVEIRIGYQRGGIWTALKTQERLEQRFGGNVTTTWTLFPAGPQLLEALNAGAIDVGATGETPPIFAQAAGTPLVYIGYTAGSGAGQGIIVPENSPIQTVEDLRGKNIAFNRASSAHLLLIRSLEAFGLNYSDVNPIFLAPPEARAAFQGGSIDAWVIWNPFLESAIQDLNARVLVRGQDIAPTRGYTLAARTFVETHPDIVLGLIEELQVAQTWANENIEEYAQIQADDTGLELSVWLNTLTTEAPAYRFIDDETIAYQQTVADLFFEQGLIPERLDIASSVWIGGENPPLEAEATEEPEVTATPNS